VFCIEFAFVFYPVLVRDFIVENSVEDVFVEVEPILRSALDGYNVCVLAYGQTATGKTFTMVRICQLSNNSLNILFLVFLFFLMSDPCKCFVLASKEGTKDQPGIVPRAIKELFKQASLENSASITFSISMLEVYMGNLKDLLAPRPVRRVFEPISRW